MPKYTHRKRWMKAIVLALGLCIAAHWDVLGVPLAHAQTLDPATTTTLNGVIVLMGVIITGLNFLMWILFWLLNIVANPDFIFIPELMNMLRQIWVFCRDVTNLLFALLLIAGAIYTTVTANTEKVKGLMPKFVMAVILVNFSWFIPRVIYDASSVLTYTVYQFPTMFTGNQCTIPASSGGGTEPCKYVSDIAFFEQATASLSTGVGGWECQLKPLLCVKLENMNGSFTATSQQSILFNGLIVNYGRLRTLVNVVDPRPATPGAPLSLTTLLATLVRFAMILVIHVALFFPVLAMVAAFFIRIPVLWLTMAFMPFVALGYVIGDKMGNWNPVEKIGNQFVRAAFLPAFVGVPFSIGYILIVAGTRLPVPAGNEALSRTIPIFMGVTNFWDLFWMMIALGVLWTGVFAVLKSDDIMGHFTETIKGTGEALGKFALKAPLAAPILPSPSGGGNQSILQLGRAIDPKRLLAGLEQSGSLEGAFKKGPESPVQISKKIDANIIIKQETKGANLANVLDGTKTGADAKGELKLALVDLRNSDEIKKSGKNYSDKDLVEAYIERRKTDSKPLSAAEEKNLRDAL